MRRLSGFLLAAACTLSSAPRAADAATVDSVATLPGPEQSDVLLLAPANPHRVFITDAWKTGGTRIIDGDSAHLAGLIDSPIMSNFSIDPAGRYFYTAESIWTRGNRGERQDLLTVYDQKTLALLFEIRLPGRLLVGDARQALETSADGRYVYVYNFDPSTSVAIVDIAQRRVIATPAIPGCGLVYPFLEANFASLCAEGAITTTALDKHRHASNTHTAPLFDAVLDPVFEQGAIDRRTGEGYFLSYTGLIYPVALARSPPLASPWSVQAAAGLEPAHTKPGEVAWRPGGIEPLALHRASGQLFVLMHIGEIYTHDSAGTELWVVDLATKKVTARHQLSERASHVAVSQDPHPLLFLNEGDAIAILDPTTGRELRRIGHVGNGILTAQEQP